MALCFTSCLLHLSLLHWRGVPVPGFSAGYWRPFSFSIGLLSGRIQVQGNATFDRRSSGNGCLPSTPRELFRLDMFYYSFVFAFGERAGSRVSALIITEELAMARRTCSRRRNTSYTSCHRQKAGFCLFYLFFGLRRTISPHWPRLLGMQLLSYDNTTSSMLLRSTTTTTHAAARR